MLTEGSVIFKNSRIVEINFLKHKLLKTDICIIS